jgi:hypothetical protein
MVGAPVLWSGGKADVPTACRAEQHTAADGGDTGALLFFGSVTGVGLRPPQAA